MFMSMLNFQRYNLRQIFNFFLPSSNILYEGIIALTWSFLIFRQVYACEDCGKEYNNKKNLVDHQKIKHQNILPFSCEHCDKRFPSGSMMRTHIKNVHSRQKCPQCGVEISNKYWFRRHMVTAHGVKQEGALQCDFCHKLFFSEACKDRHIQNNHLAELTSQLSHQR